MQLFNSPISWEQREIPVYLKHIVKAKHRRLAEQAWQPFCNYLEGESTLKFQDL